MKIPWKKMEKKMSNTKQPQETWVEKVICTRMLSGKDQRTKLKIRETNNLETSEDLNEANKSDGQKREENSHHEKSSKVNQQNAWRSKDHLNGNQKEWTIIQKLLKEGRKNKMSQDVDNTKTNALGGAKPNQKILDRCKILRRKLASWRRTLPTKSHAKVEEFS